MLRENLAAVVKMPDLPPSSGGGGGGRRCLLTLDPINSVEVIKALRALCSFGGMAKTQCFFFFFYLKMILVVHLLEVNCF